MLDQNDDIMRLSGMLRRWDDAKYLDSYRRADRKDIVSGQYYERMHKPLNLDPPQTYNEKLQWLKLYWRDARAYRCADKFSARTEVAALQHDGLLRPLLARWTSAEDMDFSRLPASFVLKASHASGFNLIVQNKAALDELRVRRLFGQILGLHYFAPKCEWVYEEAEPSIICEELFTHDPSGGPLDYKFYCFSGQVKMVHILTVTDYSGKYGEPACFLCDRFGDPLDVEYGYQTANQTLQLPSSFEKMVQIAQTLSAGFPHVRVDLYHIDEAIYFGEFTFFPASGYDPFLPDAFDSWVGSWLSLPLQNFFPANSTRMI